MAALQTLFVALGSLFFALNLFGGIASGIWLAIAGDWGSIGYGLTISLGGTFILGIALVPSIALGVAGAMAMDRSKVASGVFGLLSLAYVHLVVAVWSMATLVFFASRATESTWIPLLLWSYAIALGPWQHMAAQESQGGEGGDSSVTTVFFAQLAFLAAVVVGVAFGASFAGMAKTFAAVMALSVAFQFAVALSNR